MCWTRARPRVGWSTQHAGASVRTMPRVWDCSSHFAQNDRHHEVARHGEKLIPHHHQDHIAGKGENSLQHYNLVHKFIPMPQAMKIPAAKAAVDKEWEKLEKIPAWDLRKVRSKKEVIDEARTSGAKVHFCIFDGHVSLEKC